MILAQLQQTLQKQILHPHSNAIIFKKTSNINNHRQQFSSSAARLNIYQHAYFARLLQVLLENFPKLHLILGDKMFTEMASNYISQFPSPHISIDQIGDRLPEFLINTAPFASQPICAELATLEHMLNCIADSVNASVLTIADLAAIKPEMLPYTTLSFQPAVRCCWFSWQAPTVWQALAAGISSAMDNPPQQTKPMPWLIWRQELKVTFRSCTTNEFAFFNELAKGANIANACAALAKLLPAEQVPDLVASYLRSWFNEGLLDNTS